jgi:uncharacterized protein
MPATTESAALPAAPAYTAATRRASPVADSDRIRTIDVLRGVALLGILLMNIPAFAMPEYFAESFQRNLHSGNLWLMLVIEVFFEGKMRALFGMLFGAGVLLFIGNKGPKKTKTGPSVHRLFYRRMFCLILFGLVHAHVLLFDGDILYLYGVCGMIVYLFRNVKPRYLLLAVPIVGLLDFGGNVIEYRLSRIKRLAYVAAVAARDHGQALDDAQQRAIAAWQELEQSDIPDREAVREETRKMKSGYATVASVIHTHAWHDETRELPSELPDSVALMLLGMALFKLGFFSGKWSRERYRRIMLIGYGIGVPLVTFAFFFHLHTAPTHEIELQRMETVAIPWEELIYPFQRILLVLAHASALILAYESGLVPRLMRRFAAVGQMALSNYLSQTVICTLLFYGYAGNLYGELEYYQLYLVVLAVWTFQLLISPWWLARFRFGPVEWLWRAMTYGMRPAMRRASA